MADLPVVGRYMIQVVARKDLRQPISWLIELKRRVTQAENTDMSEGPPPRSVFFELRGVLSFIVFAFLVLRHSLVSPSLWVLETGFLVSNLVLFLLPLAWFQNPRVAYGVFLLDTAILSSLLYSVPGIDSELVLLYYLTIFMAALGQNLRRSVEVAFVAGAVYLGLRLNRQGHVTGDPAVLLSIPLFFVTAVSCGYLAQLVRSHKRQIQGLKDAQNELEAEVARAADDLTESEQLRAAAEASERRFRNLVKDIEAIVWEMEVPSFQVTFVSHQAERILGYPIERWLDERDFWVNLIHADDRQHIVALRQEAISEGHDYDPEYPVLALEYPAQAADGRVVWLRDMVRVVRDAEGRVRQLRGLMVDITERKRQEEELKARARQEAAIAELGQRALAGVDLPLLMDEAVALVAQTLEVEYSKVLELLPEGTTLVLRAGVGWKEGLVGKATVGAGADSQAGFTLLSGGPVIVEDLGAERRFSGPPLLRDHGIVSGMSVVIQEHNQVYGVLGAHSAHRRRFTKDDINFLQAAANILATSIERHRAEEALRASEEKYRSLFEDVPVGLYRSTPDGQFLDANPATIQMMGYPDRESFFTIDANQIYLHSEERERWQALMNREGIVRGFETQARRRDGKIIWLRDSARTARDSGGKVLYYEGILEDITESKQLGEQLRLSQKMEAVGRLAGGVAHDFNNLLTIITGYSQLLQGRLDPSSPLRPYAEEIQKAGDRAASLTRQLLAFSRQQLLEPRVLDLNAVVANMDKMLRRLIGEDIDLLTVLGTDLGRVKADPGQIEQVIMNLAVNSRDAMIQGGKLTLETANADLDGVYAERHLPLTPGRYVRLAVSDTGCGMDAEIQAHIFEPFFTTKEKGKGTGLGLAMVYGIVKQSGGYIWVYSELGRGTTFKIYLPRVEEAVEAIAPERARAAPHRGSETILLVEDEDPVRSFVREVLQSMGYSVLAARNGTEALALAERHKESIPLMLTDVVMPEMSGRELAERLAFRRPETKVLYMSGYTDEAILHHGVLAPGTPFLQKPFTPDVLARKVRDALDSEPRAS